MRNYTKFILIFLLISIISHTAYADTLSITYDDETDAITISGSAEDCADSAVMMQILNPGVKANDIADVTKDNFKDVFSNVFEVQTDSEGCFKAPPYTPTKSGSHSIRVKYGTDAPVLYEDAFFYMTKDYEDNVFLPSLNSDSEQAAVYIAENAALVCGFDPNYKYLSDEYLKKAAECAIVERNTAMSAKFDSREAFEVVMKASIMINLMENHKSRATDIFVFYAKDSAIQKRYSPLSLCDEYVSADSIAQIVTDTINETVYSDVSSFMYKIGEKLILKSIGDVGVYMNVETILTEHEHFFGFDLEDYKKIKDKNEVNEAIAKSNPENISELKAVINREVEKHSGDGNISYGGGGGSSSGRAPSTSAGGGVNVNIAPPATNVNPPAVSSPFTDIKDVMWAKTAIESLYSKGIINGTSANTYSPQRNVTREEFIKLLTVAFVPSLSEAEVKFSDVGQSDWFYPYVADAYNRGLVKGITDSVFGIGSPITRQDMAVMAYRYALLFGNPDTFSADKSFSDSHAISEYAKEAVHKLSGVGIVSGMGDGSFEPLGCCNRAQAAVVIYNLIKFVEGK